MTRIVSRLASLPASVRRLLAASAAAMGASIALAQGRWRLFRRDVGGAVAALHVATRRGPRSFAAWLHLARAHLRDRDWVSARRALARARDLAPERFDAVAVRILRQDGFELAVLADPVPQAAVPAGDFIHGGGPVDGGAASSRAERAPVHARAREGSLAHPLGDCRDLDEYARFRSMPPITPAEIESVDWDAVADDLLE